MGVRSRILLRISRLGQGARDQQEQRRRAVHLEVRRRRLLHGAEGHRDGARGDQARHQDHLLLEGGPVRVPRGTPPEGSGQEALGVHWVPHRVVRGEVQGEGGDGFRGRGGREEGRGEGRRRAEDRGGRRGERERGEEKEDQEGQGGIPRVGAAQQEQAVVDAQVRGRDQRGVRVVLQITVQRLGGPPV